MVHHNVGSTIDSVSRFSRKLTLAAVRLEVGTFVSLRAFLQQSALAAVGERKAPLWKAAPKCKLCRIASAKQSCIKATVLHNFCFKCGSRLLSFSLRPAASAHRVYEREAPDRHLPADSILRKTGNIVHQAQHQVQREQ